MTLTENGTRADDSSDWGDPYDDDMAGDGLEAPEDASHPEVLRCPDPDCDFSTLSARGLKTHLTKTHGTGPADTEPERPPTAPESPAEPKVAEVAPRARRQAQGGLVGRLRDRWRKTADDTAAGIAPKAARPKRVIPRGRMSVASDVSRSYARLGGRLEYTPYFPTGRIMTLQAPAAGAVIDRALAGTAVDRMVVQPMMRSKDRFAEPFYLLAPPVLTFMMQQAVIRQQEAAVAGDMETARRLQTSISAQAEMLGWMLRDSMLKLAPVMAEAAARRAEEDKIIREAFPMLGPDEDPVSKLISDLFTPPGAPPATPAEEATQDD